MTYFLDEKVYATYDVGISHTCSSEKKVVFSTKNKLIFKLAYFYFKRKYKNKMFVWRRINTSINVSILKG